MKLVNIFLHQRWISVSQIIVDLNVDFGEKKCIIFLFCMHIVVTVYMA